MDDDPRAAEVCQLGLRGCELLVTILVDFSTTQGVLLTVIWHRIWNRAKAIKSIVSICVRRELAAEVELGLVWILLFVKTIGATLPDVDNDAGNRSACGGVLDNAVHKNNLAI